MKSKIVYISGGDVFSPSEIRKGLEEIREILGLGSDVVIFGISVEPELELAKSEAVVEQYEPVSEIEMQIIKPDTIEEKIEILEPVAAVVNDEVFTEDEEISKEIIETEMPKAADTVADVDNIPAPTPAPILSVIGIVTPEVEQTIEPEEEVFSEPESQIMISETVVVSSSVDFDDDIFDGAPAQKKTLEQIFDGLESLKEERRDPLSAVGPSVSAPAAVIDTEDFDSTLSKMAEEFVNTQSNIKSEIADTSVKSGKIGKLKNVLPFKKAKKEETSLMGDLFGWAGIAANDDDFPTGGLFGTK